VKSDLFRFIGSKDTTSCVLHSRKLEWRMERSNRTAILWLITTLPASLPLGTLKTVFRLELWSARALGELCEPDNLRTFYALSNSFFLVGILLTVLPSSLLAQVNPFQGI
jgi:hypothetical protein